MELHQLTPGDIREALRVCFDPELAVNIVDLGLIDEVRVERDTEAPGVDPRYRVHLALLQRMEDEQRNAMLRAQVENRLMGMREISQTAISVSDTTWMPDRMTAAARRQLGLDRPAGTGLIQIELRPDR